MSHAIRKNDVTLYTDADNLHDDEPDSKVIKLFSCSTQRSMKFKMLISIKIAGNSALLGSDKLIMLFFLFKNVKMPTKVGILTFMSRKNFMLS